MSKLIVEYYLTGSEVPAFILEGGVYCTESADYGETYVGVTIGSTVESELPAGVNVLTRDQFLSRSILLENTQDPGEYDGEIGDADGPPYLTDDEKITIATELSSSWSEL